jgi:hypothetical protein
MAQDGQEPTMSTPSTEQIAEVLLDHQINTLTGTSVECLCGWFLRPVPRPEYAGLIAERFYREHLSPVLAHLYGEGSDAGPDSGKDEG